MKPKKLQTIIDTKLINTIQHCKYLMKNILIFSIYIWFYVVF